jgi:hypothetical protein
MRLKLKHLRHPLRTADAVKALIAARLNMRRLAVRGERRFARDPRFCLQSVTDGFAPRIDRSADTALLERICTAYIKAEDQQQFVPRAYKASKWWEQVRQATLGPVMHALLTRDIDALRRAYRNFFRDPCSTGLIGVPYGMSRPYSEDQKDHRRLYLIDVLYRLDHWIEQTGGRFEWRDLAGPGIGNPFGVVIAGTLVEAGAEYRHYCAHRMSSLLDSEKPAVAEIGGGFGGMPYYLFRDRTAVTYLDFDVPESLALASYYLTKAFPHLTFLLYGEGALNKEAIARSDVVLMPLSELAAMPADSVDVTFSSHALSDISREAMLEYLRHIAHMSKRCFMNIGTSRAARSLSGLIARNYDSLRLAETRRSGWNKHKTLGADEVESLYRIGE